MLVASLVAGCGTGASAGAPEGTPRPTPTPAPLHVVFPLQAQNGSAVTGTADLLVIKSGTLVVTVRVSGLAPSSTHASHIHRGRCGTVGPVERALQNVVADGSGAADTVTILEDFVYQPPPAGWYLNVHAGPDLTGPNARGIVCGDSPPLS